MFIFSYRFLPDYTQIIRSGLLKVEKYPASVPHPHFGFAQYRPAPFPGEGGKEAKKWMQWARSAPETIFSHISLSLDCLLTS